MAFYQGRYFFQIRRRVVTRPPFFAYCYQVLSGVCEKLLLVTERCVIYRIVLGVMAMLHVHKPHSMNTNISSNVL